MNEFLPNELTRFLIAADQHLQQKCELIIVGGAAATIAYDAGRATTDIDTQNQLSKSLRVAFEKARKETGFSIPVTYVGGICEGPYDYEERLMPVCRQELRNLQIHVPEQHDLALMKIVRGNENDIQGIVDIHQNHPFDLEILTQRFIDDMTHVTGRPRTLKLNFLAAIANLFGEEIADSLDGRLKSWRENECD